MKQYDFPDLNAVGKGIVRYFSITNPWMDFVVIVEKDEKEYVRQIIYEAMDEYWASDFEAYGDVVERNLTEANISFQIAYHNPQDESDEYEDAWERYLDSLYHQK